MISKATEQRLDELHAAQGTYRPSAKVSAALHSKTLVMAIGATCMGKNTVMSRAAEQHPELSVVGTITTRPPRSDDGDRYTYFEQTDTGLAPLIEKIERGELVQYIVNPYSHFVYASSLDDYPGTICMGDYFSSVVEPYKTYGFKQILPVSIVTDAASWRGRFETRFPAGHPDRQARLAEAAESLGWSLAQGETHHWAVNRDGQADAAVASIMNALADTPGDSTEARQLAAACLEVIQELQHG